MKQVRLWTYWILVACLLISTMPGAKLRAQQATPDVTPMPPVTPKASVTVTAGAQSPLTATIPAVTPTVSSVPTPTVEEEAMAVDRVVDAWMASTSVADRVGQLFLIEFPENNVSFDSDITELVYGYRVGGVVLSPRNGNFSNREKDVETPEQVAILANQLQALAYGALLPVDQALVARPDTPEFTARYMLMEQLTDIPPINIPMWIAVEQAGDNLPNTALRRGFTPLPSQMAMGATWNPDLTRKVGAIVGRELSAVGVNMLFGPNLDVIEVPHIDEVGSLAIQSFGGDPYWVSQMGRAYIAGVHEGSDGRLVTVARHFPGAGDTDRLPNEEVSTVHRSLEELQRVTLPPFLAVTQQPSSIMSSVAGDPGATDAMMSSHIRYSGIQGNNLVRNTPISLAPELEVLLEQEGFDEWRTQGGLMVSNELGAPAIRRYYSPSLEDFPIRRIALDAFTAGHDVLYLGSFGLDDNWETIRQNIKDTIGFFQDRYIRDPDFAAEVDESVRRILRLKANLYLPAIVPNAATEAGGEETTEPSAPIRIPPVGLADVLVQEADLAILTEEARKESLVTVGQVARESITILHPDPQVAPGPISLMPQASDRLVIFTESRLLQECATCIADAAVGPEQLAKIIVQFYGPSTTGEIATGQVNPEQIVSLTFSDLADFLAAEPGLAGANTAPLTPAPSALIPTPTAVLAAPVEAPPVGEDVETEDRMAKIRKWVSEANWLIFAMLDVDPVRHPNSDVVKRFLRLRGDELANKHIVVLALQAPYFLDATEISKLDVYLGVYSKTQPFLESAVRALFRTYTPSSAPPVNVAGTRFASLSDRLAPDATRHAPLRVLDANGAPLAAATDSNDPLPQANAGQLLRLEAGPWLDRNGKPVHDGMMVEYQLIYEGEEAAYKIETAPTRNGLAVRDVQVDRPGVVRVTARVGNATTGEPVAVTVREAEVAAVIDATNPASAAVTEVAISSTVPISVAEASGQRADGDLMDGIGALAASGRIPFVSLVLALFVMLATLGMLLITQIRVVPRKTLVHSMLVAVNWGLLAYVVYTLGVGLGPGENWLPVSLRVFGPALIVFVATLVPLLWVQLRTD